MRDIARESGVSSATVSRALSSPERVADHTRALVEAAAVKLGYVVTHAPTSFVPRRNGTIGLVVPDLENPYFGAISKGVQERARAAGYTVYVADAEEDDALEADIVRSMALQADGIILCAARSTDSRIEEFATRVPLVSVNRILPNVPSLAFDNAGAVRCVMDHLLALGHKKVAYAGGPKSSWSNTQRHNAFLAYGEGAPGLELIDLGSFPPYFSGGVFAGDLAIASGATGVVAFNDLIALGIINRLQQRGLNSPADMSVAGFDNISFSAYARPDLTTVDFPRIRMGHASFDVLLDILLNEGSDHYPTRELPVELVVRHSTNSIREFGVFQAQSRRIFTTDPVPTA